MLWLRWGALCRHRRDDGDAITYHVFKQRTVPHECGTGPVALYDVKHLPNVKLVEPLHDDREKGVLLIS
ncbi:hypothetical protein DQ04_04221010 [Trypanosoma grayi]|uniref:hypothetical protein n=1 Tax=Trypanosoma grayi TaxID=71804 RepID=UPI0004F485EF|nr:hypothetical protein DQ04_04221010 [Trypanosoma grayi]KEG10069.1 hypothetical protein DQ04_04221010 [Trypanosoma grayi]